MSFWLKLQKPFFVLAPMADVTDASFRRVIARLGKPDVMWTEFVSADGLILAPEEGKQKLLKDLMFTEEERPIVAQLFSSKPEIMEKAAALIQSLGFDGLDINMGCPDRSVEKQGAGAALIKNKTRAQELVYAAKQGAPGLPISVKTRIGYNKDELLEWLPILLETKPSAITIHARTRKEMSLVPARWEHVKHAVDLRNAICPETLILGNGDAVSLLDAQKKVLETGCDGVMLGRAIFGNPWLFSQPAHVPSIQEKLKTMLEHTKLFSQLLGDVKSFAIMKKHYKAYVSGFDGAKELRVALMETSSFAEVESIVDDFLKTLV